MRSFSVQTAIVLCFSISFLISCKKSSTSDEDLPATGYYMKYNIDGRTVVSTDSSKSWAVSLNTDPTGAVVNYSLIISFIQDSVLSGINNLSVFVSSNQILSAGTYQDPQKYFGLDGTKKPSVTVQYTDEKSRNFFSMGEAFNEDGSSAVTPTIGVADARVNFTEADATHIKGTFSVTVFSSEDYRNSYRFTGGAFSLPVRSGN